MADEATAQTAAEIAEEGGTPEGLSPEEWAEIRRQRATRAVGGPQEPQEAVSAPAATQEAVQGQPGRESRETRVLPDGRTEVREVWTGPEPTTTFEAPLEPRATHTEDASIPTPHKVPGEVEMYHWVEYLRPNQGRFTHRATGWVVEFEPMGYAGSIVEIPGRIARDPFFRRLVPRGFVRFLDDGDAQGRLPSLPVRDDVRTNAGNRILEILNEDPEEAAKRGDGHFKKRGLPEVAMPTGPDMTAEQIWAEKNEGVEPGDVRRVETWNNQEG